MATSLGQLLHTLVGAAQATESGPVARADAGTALGHLGRALHLLGLDGVSAAVDDEREQQVAALAAACAELGARAPATEATVTPLAAAAADTVGILGERGTVGGRWAAAVALADAATALTELLADGLHAGPAAQWVTEIARQAALVQQSAALQPSSRADAALLDHPLPFADGVHAADPAVVVLDATAVLVHATATTAEVPSIAEVLAYTVAAEALSEAAHALAGATRRDPAADQLAAAQIPAAQAWRAVRAALGPYDDGSRRLHPHAPPTVQAAGRLHAALRRADPDPTSWPAPLRAAVAASAQHLPTLATGLHHTARSWAGSGVLLAYAVDLPPRDDRVTEFLRGHRSGGLVRADAVDLRPVLGALHQAVHHARLLSAAVAAHAPDPPARRTVDLHRRGQTAPRARHEQPQPAAALRQATEQANRHQQATRGRPTGRGRPR